MRIHTDNLDRHAIELELKVEKLADRIAPHVTFKRLTSHRSTVRAIAYEIQLEAAERDRGRRAGNSGSYGAMQPEYDGYAATFDEWGWLLAALYDRDPRMVVGQASAPVYADALDFHRRTGYTYHPEALIGMIERNIADGDEPAEADPYPYVIGKAGEGRRGFGRVTIREAYDWSYSAAQNAYVKWLDNPHARTGNDRVAFRPRTIADVREFAKLAPATVGGAQ